MKKIFLLASLFFVFNAIAQDDMPDSRKKTEAIKRVAQKEIKNDLSSFTMAGISEGVVLDKLTKIPITNSGPTFMSFEGDNLKATVTTGPFNPAKHKLFYDDADTKKYLVKIDRKTYYGGYPNVPKTKINNITLIIGKDTLAIPPIAYADLYNLNFSYGDKAGNKRSTNGIYRSKDGHRTYLYLFSKDNTGSYEVTFVFQDKVFMRRVLDWGFM